MKLNKIIINLYICFDLAIPVLIKTISNTYLVNIVTPNILISAYLKPMVIILILL